MDFLRRLCSTVQQLSLSADALLLMAWGPARDSSCAFVRPSGSFSGRAPDRYISFLLPFRWSQFYIDDQLRVQLFPAVPLPSSSNLHLHVEREDEAAINALLERQGDRVEFLSIRNPSLQNVLSAAVVCTALTSLCITSEYTSGLREDQLSSVFAGLAQCTSLTELTLVVGNTPVWDMEPVQMVSLPQLRHLHLNTHCALHQIDSRPGQPANILTPSLTHLVLVIDLRHATALCRSINTQRFPHLTRCHLRCTQRWGRESSGWREANASLRARLGDVWCEKEEEVIRWRADRVWRRSIGLPDVGLPDEEDEKVQQHG